MTQPPHTRVLQQAAEPMYDLTIVTVCRNVLPQLKRTTASVLGQKAVYPDVSIEHVIVDGASTDGTPEWLAEMKEQGKIESYVSEPDRGIYDAMNKGINLARGAVTLFINADDTLEFVDLAPCVTPILRGETTLVAATTRNSDDAGGTMKLYRPDERLLYLYAPVSHQAFFAKTQLLRELGGFSAADFRCMADMDFMCSAIVQEGFPTVVPQTVSTMPAGGFSGCAFVRFCDEYINIMFRFRERIIEKCRESSSYHQLITASLLNHCISIQFMPRKDAATHSAMLEQLQALCTQVAACGGSFMEKRVLQYIITAYIPALRGKGKVSLLHKLRSRLYTSLYRLPEAHPYSGILRMRRTSILRSACGVFQRKRFRVN